jgi:hypothetical protein
VHATRLGHRTLEHPLGQRRVAQRLARVDVFLHHLRHVQPAGLLPQLERALLHAEAPAHGLVHVTRVVGNGAQVDGGVVEAVAQDGPEELALRAFAVAQQAQALCGRLLEHAAIDLVGLGAARHVLPAVELEAQHIAADLLVEAGLGLLAQVAQLQQLLQHGGRAETGVERIRLDRQVVLQGLDHVRERIQAHHVRGAEGARAGATELLAGQVVDHIPGQAEILDLLHRRQHAGDADAVGHEVGGVVGAHHALAQAAGHKGFQIVQDLRVGGGRVDQLHQRHVARRIEKMDAAEARLERLGQRLAQRGDRQARGVGGDDGVRRDEGRDLLVQVAFPVHALGNGLDDEVTVAQLLHVLLVVGLADQHRVVGHAQRRRLELLQSLDGTHDDAVLRPLLGRQIEQHDLHLDVDQVCGNLRTHHARAEHGDFANLESRHSLFSVSPARRTGVLHTYSTRSQTWVR